LVTPASQPLPLLTTKLSVPRTRQQIVVRQDLLHWLDTGLQRKLTLVSAPAGFGKSTLLASWAHRSRCHTAWLSLDAGDNDPVRFLTYLVAAVRSVLPDVGAQAANALQSPQPPATEMILASLLNDISAMTEQAVLVLDDFHLIDSAAIDNALSFIVEYLPEQLHLAIATRQDPALPLARMRARGELSELRASDLRMSNDEAAEFLNTIMGLNLSVADVAALEARTEGWVAGLQLAALSMQGQGDVSGFIRAFAGDHRYIADYLIDEVLQRQPEPVRDFLLQTAILERLHGPLCDAVTGMNDSDARLDALARGNFFVIPLDNQRRWFRYHHLFADVLRAHAQSKYAGDIAELHRRAAAWHEDNGTLNEAVQHALSARAPERAADMLERALPELRRARLGITLLGWLTALPDDVVRRRPVLSVAYAWALLAKGEQAEVKERLRDGERWLDANADRSAMVVQNDEEFRLLPGTIAIYRAALAQAAGDLATTVEQARIALDFSPPDDHVRRGAAAGLLGIALWTVGDLEVAYLHFAAGMDDLRRGGHRSDVINGAITLADIRVAQGHLRDAERVLDEAVRQAAAPDDSGTPVPLSYFVGLSELRLERNDLDAATAHLNSSESLTNIIGPSHDASRWYVAMANIELAQGNPNAAVDLLGHAERVYAADLVPDLRPIAALRARLWIRDGMLDEALAWARERTLSIDDELSYLHEYEHITLAQALLARDTHGRERPTPEVLAFLDRLLQAAEAGERVGSVIEIVLLQAIARERLGEHDTARALIERALKLAEPEGYVRIFVDAGTPIRDLLETALEYGITPSYTRRLLTAFGERRGGQPAGRTQPESISEREIDVLRLLGSDLSGPEIANELLISLNTMRTHTKNIYGKLGVTSRRAAVRRAGELNLLKQDR